LKQIDIEFMRRLHTKVNLIPVIAKADTMTDEEIAEFKERVNTFVFFSRVQLTQRSQILSDIAYHNIHIFQAPTYDNEDEETIAEAEEIASKIPFAVVGSDKIVNTPDGRKVRGRAYPWGVVEVDNEDHCDFVKLRQMLVRTYMEELREYTNDVLYENWRTEKLLSMGVAQDSTVFKEIKCVTNLWWYDVGCADSFFIKPGSQDAGGARSTRSEACEDGGRDEDGIPAESTRERGQT
jgi:septin 7